jgi:thermitase
VRRRLGLALATLAVAFWAAAGAQSATAPGDLVVRLDPAASGARAAALADLVGGEVVGSLPQLGAYLIDLPDGSGPVSPVLDVLRRQAGVRGAAVPGELRLFDDPLQASQWHLSKISAATAWSVTQGNAGVVIAIVDTGIDYSHPDLAGRVTLGPDFGSDDADPLDTQGHGTHVAGIAAAILGNGLGGAGVCPGCRLLAVKVFPDGSGSASDFDVAQGIVWAADNGADVVNLSLGGPGGSTTLRDAVDYAWSHGVVVVAAAGNSGDATTSYPAAYANAIAVAATTSSDTRASFSTYGSWVDVAAPGVSILSTVPGGSYQSWSGTSMAAPVVAGAAGLAFAGLSGATNVSVRAALEAAVVDLGATGRDAYFGAGRVDLSRLFSAAPAPGGAPSVTTATLPSATVWTAYRTTLAATGGTTPYTWSIAAGALPRGLSLSPSTGAIAGTPYATGTSSFTVRVRDAAGATATKAFTLTVSSTSSGGGGDGQTGVDLSGTWTSATRTSKGTAGVTAVFRLTATGASGTVVSQAVVRCTLLSSTGATLGEQLVTVSSLGVGQTRYLTLQWPGQSGSGMTVRATIDPDNLVAETNESNNLAARAVA